MRTIAIGRLFITAVAVVSSLGIVTPAAAQTAPAALPRFDASASLGWFIGNEPAVRGYDTSWYADSGVRSLAAGYYWTEHHKTALDVQWAGTGNAYGSHPETDASVNQYGWAESRLWSRAVVVDQHYQFGHNARFHPYVSAGLGLEWAEHQTDLGVLYGPRSLVLKPAQSLPTETDMRGIARFGTGFKAYLSERAFFRSDFRLAFAKDHTDHVTTSFGFGVDF